MSQAHPSFLRHRADSDLGSISEASGRVGVGLELRVEQGGIIVKRVMEGGPASFSEPTICVGDRLTHVEGSAVGCNLSFSSSRILGAPGCTVGLEFLRGKSTRVSTMLTRDGEFSEWRSVQQRLANEASAESEAADRNAPRVTPTKADSLRLSMGVAKSRESVPALLAEKAKSWLFTQLSGMTSAFSARRKVSQNPLPSRVQ
jgi:hypothetical protein